MSKLGWMGFLSGGVSTILSAYMILIGSPSALFFAILIGANIPIMFFNLMSALRN